MASKLKLAFVGLCLLLLSAVNNAEEQCFKVSGKAPKDLLEFGYSVGKCFVLSVTGTTKGYVWGSDVYAIDSVLGKAAVHAGLLRPGQTRILQARVLAGPKFFQSSSKNGVTTLAYNHRSYRFVVGRALNSAVSCQRVSGTTPEHSTLYSNGVGKCFEFSVTGATSGDVWGSDVYTINSPLSKAAVHAGLLRPGQVGFVRIFVLPGQSVYLASSKNGVTSLAYHHRAYQFIEGQAEGSTGTSGKSQQVAEKKSPVNG